MNKHKYCIPYIEQSEQSECGLCALAMILSYYYCEYSLVELREQWTVGRDGLNLLILKNIASSLHFKCKGFKVRSIMDIPVPAIINIRQNHFIVLEKVTKNSVKIIDPAQGRYELSIEEFQNEDINVGLLIQPTDKINRHKKKSNLSEYKKLISSEYPLILTILISTILLQFISLLVPIGIQFISDNIFNIEKNISLNMIGALIVGVILLNFGLNLIKSKVIISLQVKFDQKLVSTFVKKLLNLPFSFFECRSSGDLFYRYNSNVIVREMLSNRIISIWLDIGLIIIFLVYMWSSNIKLAAFITFMAILQITILCISVPKNKELLGKEVMRQAATSNFFVEIIKSASIVKTKGAEKIVYEKWHDFFDKQMESMKRRGNFSNKINSLTQSIQFSAPVLLLFISISEVLSGRLTIGGMFSFYTISSSFLAPISSIILTINEIIYANVHFNRILEVLNSTEENNIDSGESLETLNGNIKIENVTFRYGIHSNEAIRNINLKINQGEFVAVVGETGSGKSTLALLMLGLIEPTEGNIYFDEMNIKNLNKSEFRKKIGVVTQDMYLFNQSIKDNIAFGRKDITLYQVENACKNAEIYSEIMQMPMGFETVLSENGNNISGGQKQRLSIARALIDEPSIIMLDEATSALDTITEEKIRRNLDKLNCTRVVIAHRLNTIINADRVVVLRNGKIEDAGTHSELINRCPYYIELYKSNMKKEIISGNRKEECYS